MCGIAGLFDPKGSPCLESELTAMQRALLHRGPDDSGRVIDGGLGLAFQRLSILDLERGHQPMATPDGRFTIVFNGEIYNHLELRKEMQADGRRFATHSDTETLLAGFSREGPEFFKKLNGMFACAIWDSKERALTLARDPLGIKPLYLWRSGGRLHFASELRSLLAAGAPDALSPAAVLDYLAYGYVHAPSTVLAAIEKFPPGHWLSVSARGAQNSVRFWSLPEAKTQARVVDERKAQEELGSLLRDAVRDQMLSDVPVGVFLSGGIDSSVVTALMTRASKTPVESYSIGFDGDSVDETAYAEIVSRHLGTRHETIRLPADILDALPDMIACLDEPVADAAILPTWRLSVSARRRVKVVLTGEGGDELFGGYGRHKAAYVTETLDKLPSWLRAAAAPAARRLGSGTYFKSLPLKGAPSWALAESGPRLKAALGVLVPEAAAGGLTPWLAGYEGLSGLNGMLAFDLQTSMADQLLMKVDKTTMRASLEARMPLLDLRLVDFMFRLPPALKVRLFRGKYLLRRVAAGLLPREIVARRKHGFILRTGSWLRSPKNAIAADALTGGALAVTGLFRRGALESGLKGLRGGSSRADPDVYFRLVVLSLWLSAIRAPAPAGTPSA
ncbi:MAG: asparagine synthase (glutamine-hydrolyzing) [Elusimicrobia bacterium]|nr:asparagine synthase (glutamine-hydrolyzing) [Elusimicrobiota bacterium]